LVYISTQNIKFSKGLAQKLNSKFIGPYRIIQDYANGTFKIELPSELKRQGLHPAFHSSLLRPHIPKDDQLFPGCLASQLGPANQLEPEWNVSKIITHQNLGVDAVFQVEWGSGDHTWLPYHEVVDLDALGDYFDILGISEINQLKMPRKQGMEINRENTQLHNLELNNRTSAAEVVLTQPVLQSISHNESDESEEILKPHTKGEKNQVTTLTSDP
jgi:hypothetical protein